MSARKKQICLMAATVIVLAAALWIILPALASSGDYGVTTGATPQRLQPTATRVAPPTSTPVPPTPVPTAVPQPTATCAPNTECASPDKGSG